MAAVPSHDVDDPRRSLAAFLAEAGDAPLLVVTGAGVSVASGIPTFRGSDPDAVWAKDVTELGTRDYFQRDPVGSWRWYLERFDRVQGARPNPAHHALVELERWQVERGGDFLLVTQNVDTLHEQAGSVRLVKVHGSADRVRCSAQGCALAAPHGWLPRQDVDLAPFRRAMTADHLPRCPRCGALLRQHVLWFDEHYHEHDDYQIERVAGFASRAARMLFVGTSFSVGITDLLVELAWRTGAAARAIDPAASGRRASWLPILRAPAEELLPAALALARTAAARPPDAAAP